MGTKIRATVSVALPLAALCACNTPQSSMNPAGPAGRSLAQIGWVTYVLFGVIAFGMWGLIVWAAVRKPGNLAEHEPWNIGGGQNWIFFGGLAFPLIVLSGMFVFAMDRMAQFPLHPAENVKPMIRVIGHQWWWQVEYLEGGAQQEFETANEIHIPVGKPVDIILESADVIHSFWIPALHGKVEMIPGQPNFIRIQASHAGDFDGECGEFCGMQHAHMRLLVVAQDPADYEKWRQQQLQPAAVPDNQEALHGRDVFNNTACALCHTVRGTVAQGKVAPDLTHIGSRQYIAANSFRNNQANLEAWVTHAQSLKPGAEMPDLTEYSGVDLRALVTYLQSLK